MNRCRADRRMGCIVRVLMASVLCVSGCLRFGYEELGHHDASNGPDVARMSDGGDGSRGDGELAGADAAPVHAGGDGGGVGSSGDSGIDPATDSGTRGVRDAATPRGDSSIGIMSDSGIGDAGSQERDASVDGGASSTPCADAPPDSRRIDIRGSQVVAGPHLDFPVLVSLAGDWLRDVSRGGSVLDARGTDLRFAADAAGASQLDFEVERYDPAAGALTAWVRVPSLSVSTTFYLLYGECAGMLAPRGEAVWTRYAAVYHLEDNRDASGQGNDCTAEGVVPNAVGHIGGGRAFDRAAGTLNCGSAGIVDDLFQGGGFVSMWVNASTASSGTAGRVISKEDRASMNQSGWALFLDATPSGSLLFNYDAFDPRSGSWTSAADSVPLGGWHWIAIQYSNSSTAEVPMFFVDGQPVGLGNMSATPGGTAESDAATVLYIGNLGDVSRSFEGALDELRLSAAPRTPGWVSTEYNNQRDPAGFYTVTPP